MRYLFVRKFILANLILKIQHKLIIRLSTEYWYRNTALLEIPKLMQKPIKSIKLTNFCNNMSPLVKFDITYDLINFCLYFHLFFHLYTIVHHGAQFLIHHKNLKWDGDTPVDLKKRKYMEIHIRLQKSVLIQPRTGPQKSRPSLKHLPRIFQKSDFGLNPKRGARAAAGLKENEHEQWKKGRVYNELEKNEDKHSYNIPGEDNTTSTENRMHDTSHQLRC